MTTPFLSIIYFFVLLKTKKNTISSFVIIDLLLLSQSHTPIMVSFFFKKSISCKKNIHALYCHINLLNEK